MHEKTRTSRRTFLGSVAAGTVALSQARASAQDRPLRAAVIGTGWYGMVDAKAALEVGGVEIAAVCDVDSEHLEASAKQLETLQGKRPRTYKLYETMLADGDLDFAIIATPPHWHALQLIACLDAGLDVYAEKPLAYDVREGRAMVNAVKKSGRVVQVGFQRRQSAAFGAAREFIRGGGAGRIVQVDAQIHYRAGTKDATPQPPPASLDWDLWCGPGPEIPYSPQVGHHNWRLERTSGHGHLVDWGIHLVDTIRFTLGLAMPKSVTAVGGLYEYAGKITTPDTLTAHFEFEKCPVVWRHRLWGAREYSPDVNNGIFFFGDKATVFATDSRWVVLPRGRGAEPVERRVDSKAGTLHMADFLEAVKSRRQPTCTIEDGYGSTATVQLAMAAYETGMPVRWNASSETIDGNSEAAGLLRREYRKPWVHPYAP